MENNKTKVLIAATLAATMLLAGVQAASAAEVRNGYRECSGAQKVQIASNTSNTGGAFAVAHSSNGGVLTTWFTPGAHASNTGLLASNWSVSTTGTIVSANSSCAL